MTPILHGRVHPETSSSSLVRRELRILLDPRFLEGDWVARLIDLNVLCQYLASLPGSPCTITLLAPSAPDAGLSPALALIRQYGGEVLPYGGVVVPDAATALADLGVRHPDFLTLVSTAFAADADVVMTRPPGPDVVFDQDLFRQLSITVGGFELALHAAEVFVRGHQVPWSFRHPMWNCPWTPFYSMAEPAQTLIALHQRAHDLVLDAATVELLRSLALNRHSALSYTRDQLLFYVLQRRAATRNKLGRQDFAFELGYFLNSYYLLLWAGLDQLCRAMNTLFGLGLTKKELRRASAFNKVFHKALRRHAPDAAALFDHPGFAYWATILKSGRHWAAHEGFTMPSVLYMRSETEPTDEELDREVDCSEEWRRLKETDWLAPGAADTFRPQLKFQARLRRYKAIAEPIQRLDIDGEEILIFPLVNIEWHFENFFTVANRIAELALERLAAAGVDRPSVAAPSN